MLDALDYGFHDATRIQLFGTPQEKQEYRNRMALSALPKKRQVPILPLERVFEELSGS